MDKSGKKGCNMFRLDGFNQILSVRLRSGSKLIQVSVASGHSYQRISAHVLVRAPAPVASLDTGSLPYWRYQHTPIYSLA